MREAAVPFAPGILMTPCVAAGLRAATASLITAGGWKTHGAMGALAT